VKGSPKQRGAPGFSLSQSVPVGTAKITARSLNDAAGVGVAVAASCVVCPNADPPTNAKASALANALAANNLLITPPREFFLCS